MTSIVKILFEINLVKSRQGLTVKRTNLSQHYSYPIHLQHAFLSAWGIPQQDSWPQFQLYKFERDNLPATHHLVPTKQTLLTFIRRTELHWYWTMGWLEANWPALLVLPKAMLNHVSIDCQYGINIKNNIKKQYKTI